MVPQILAEHLTLQPVSYIHEMLGHTREDFCFPCNTTVGLVNTGNTCYANSLLQALSALTHVQHWARQHLRIHSKPNHLCVFCTLGRDLTQLVSSPHSRNMTPMIVQTQEYWRSTTFVQGHQEDVTEFWAALLDTCNEIDLQSYNALLDTNLAQASPVRYTTPFWNIFGIRGYDMTTCNACGQTTASHWCRSELQLDIPRGNKQTLQSCIEAYFLSNALEDRNDKCEDRCRRHGCRRKQAYVTAWPDILTIQLKRWIPTVHGTYIKEHRPVSLPQLLKDLPGAPTVEYNLRAAVIHQGEAGAGHYINMTKSRDDDSRILSSDTSITRNAANILGQLQQAFLIVYERA